MLYYIGTMPVSPHLKHFGIIGQKWGVRRYQNEDGSLTDEGRSHYGVDVTRNNVNEFKERLNDFYEQAQKSGRAASTYRGKAEQKANSELKKTKEYKEYSSFMDQLEQLAQQYPGRQIQLEGEAAKYGIKLQEAYDKKRNELLQKHSDAISSATLKDLGYDDTEAGRKWIKKALKW